MPTKFAWLKAVLADPRLTDKDARVGAIYCIQFTHRDGTGWPKEMTALAEAMQTSARGVSDHFLKYCRLGYLVETYRASTGRGIPAKRAYDLTLPITDTVERQCSETTDTVERDHRHSAPRSPTLHSAITDVVERNQTIADQPKDTPTSTYTSTYTSIKTSTDTQLTSTKLTAEELDQGWYEVDGSRIEIWPGDTERKRNA